MPFVVGLTGGIASGKTTVANLFQSQFGIEIVDADVVAREVVEPGSEGLKAIEERWGSGILLHDGTLNRAKLREVIFANEEEKAWINGLLHPMIREKMQADIAKVTSPYGLLVIPLMVENNLQSLADRVLVVDVDKQTQMRRTVERDGVPLEQVESILAAQASRTQRLAIADDVIKNNATNQELLPQITELHQKYLEICRENR
ncbi:dephospho-CoA kinase [Vibrio coralliilyticus]|jgi:dephospho-CoA kinase|uniref:Dephospho-CoA kinase n=1 Tax=Vibrio coralliilyticus TaxID=190893 RepID=A0AAN0SEN8_9VIBR|nr:dephospho-CoA kinase [Vibrio coralliilyticus]AIW19901.1 dephospho-CoA kinase [Vibrio coralliilyticus]NOH40626.1 dephospho-CoA kinase [Vibrio coralliilyticus]NOI59624.1 dephospho-CoA kinase [Vibrio coralliilyticus]NRF24544.1 dephospho-CoA kinase [Vibrio coralliilyticus]NRF63783.1 dephospho-CoA kinase [Vibrio coralliilyticus]